MDLTASAKKVLLLKAYLKKLNSVAIAQENHLAYVAEGSKYG